MSKPTIYVGQRCLVTGNLRGRKPFIGSIYDWDEAEDGTVKTLQISHPMLVGLIHIRYELTDVVLLPVEAVA